VVGWLILQERLTCPAFIRSRQFAEKFTAIQAGFTAVSGVSDILNEPIESDPDEAVSREWRIVSGEAQAGEIDLNTSGLPTKTTITLLKT